VRDREFGNLLAIPDNYPKKVVSMDDVAGGSYHGIKHVRLADFLLALCADTNPQEAGPGKCST
jgi:hypothetical protein